MIKTMTRSEAADACDKAGDTLVTVARFLRNRIGTADAMRMAVECERRGPILFDVADAITQKNALLEDTP